MTTTTTATKTTTIEIHLCKWTFAPLHSPNCCRSVTFTVTVTSLARLFWAAKETSKVDHRARLRVLIIVRRSGYWNFNKRHTKAGRKVLPIKVAPVVKCRRRRRRWARLMMC